MAVRIFVIRTALVSLLYFFFAAFSSKEAFFQCADSPHAAFEGYPQAAKLHLGFIWE
jgi:hypothetical protein